MKIFLSIIFCTVGLTASAQFWHRKPKLEEIRSPQLEEVKAHTPITFVAAVNIPAENAVHDSELPRKGYSLQAAENLLIHEAKYNMHYRIFNVASANFTDLASFYILQNRFSEAQWYLLQSNAITRTNGDNKRTLSNLLMLADIKARIGENALAQAELQEARDLAINKGLLADLSEIDKKIKYLQTTKIVTAKPAMRYAESVEAANSKTVVN
jgi:hypothetical protein